MTLLQDMADFVTGSTFNDISKEARDQLKIRVLDGIGCAIGALDGDPMRMVRAHTSSFEMQGKCTLIGGGNTAPDRAAFHNGALVRYLDFNDSYLAKGETCHPSDNLAPVLAAAEFAGQDGREFLTALAVAYQVQCRLSDVAPVRAKGFDHTAQGAYAVAAGVSRALGLDREKTANAIAISGTAFNALRVTRTGSLSHWKGLAYPNTAFGCTHAALLAMQGITGPQEVFEGNKGFMEAIAGHFELAWQKENLERVRQTILKKYNAEIHSQASIDGLLELKRESGFKAADVERVELETFDVAYHIIGGGEEGDKTTVRIKEEADHSLPYMLAVAILDDGVMPEQYAPERIRRQDVQELLRKVHVRAEDAFSRRFPDEMPCRIIVGLKNGSSLEKSKRDYEGFHTNPARWESAVRKFERLSRPFTTEALRSEIVDTISGIEDAPVSRLTGLLSLVQCSRDASGSSHKPVAEGEGKYGKE
ncbi:MAG TPA: MmgE/PrpD family protein [Terriglobia bacterium]|nr:MmgE/PrpD family protein [Terriglobia bacterium]